ALAAEATTVGGCDYANARGGQLQNLGQRTMHVVGRLRRRPERELLIRRPQRDGGMLLHREVRTPFEEEEILPHHVALGDASVGIAELQIDEFVEVAAVAVVVNARLR